MTVIASCDDTGLVERLERALQHAVRHAAVEARDDDADRAALAERRALEHACSRRARRPRRARARRSRRSAGASSITAAGLGGGPALERIAGVRVLAGRLPELRGSAATARLNGTCSISGAGSRAAGCARRC